ncbi:hypothetical protein [Paracoccus everestensis]|uniref:hypothetical protein n=1 Tax=Paracoccus everestensis TaxID=2903900 RepID=UPI001F3AE414|nr:hypothetical protein [Paracoccus everestensis]
MKAFSAQKYLPVAVTAILLSYLPPAAFAQVAPQPDSVTEAAQRAADAAESARQTLEVAVPKGAVMAFNLEECPREWSPFQPLSGRFALGAGEGNRDQTDQVLITRVLREEGGVENHTLTVNEIPSHSHTYMYSSGDDSPKHTDDKGNEFGDRDRPNQPTGKIGGSKPHQNMPPFYVLQYCQRD